MTLIPSVVCHGGAVGGTPWANLSKPIQATIIAEAKAAKDPAARIMELVAGPPKDVCKLVGATPPETGEPLATG